MNGETIPHLGTVILPFIDIDLLRSTEERLRCREGLSDEEEKRGCHFGNTLKFLRESTDDTFILNRGLLVEELPLELKPEEAFVSELIAGTLATQPGFSTYSTSVPRKSSATQNRREKKQSLVVFSSNDVTAQHEDVTATVTVASRCHEFSYLSLYAPEFVPKTFTK
jgi:hypothetical protein